MKRCLLIVFCLALASCASYKKDIRHIKHNPAEIVAFRQYLEDNYALNEFTKYETIWGKWGTQPDSLIRQFCIENNITSIVKLPASTKSNYHDQYGNIVQLYFGKNVLESNQCIIFDYTEKGLDAYVARYGRLKVAERVYIFDESEFSRMIRETFNPDKQAQQAKLDRGPYTIDRRQ